MSGELIEELAMGGEFKLIMKGYIRGFIVGSIATAVTLTTIFLILVLHFKMFT